MTDRNEVDQPKSAAPTNDDACRGCGARSDAHLPSCIAMWKPTLRQRAQLSTHRYFAMPPRCEQPCVLLLCSSTTGMKPQLKDHMTSTTRSLTGRPPRTILYRPVLTDMETNLETLHAPTSATPDDGCRGCGARSNAHLPSCITVWTVQTRTRRSEHRYFAMSPGVYMRGRADGTIDDSTEGWGAPYRA
jgi:hypothetical protein